MANWDIVLTHPEDEKWHLVSNEVSFGLLHDCSNDDNPMIQMYRECGYCDERSPEALWGMYKLAEWGAE